MKNKTKLIAVLLFINILSLSYNHATYANPRQLSPVYEDVKTTQTYPNYTKQNHKNLKNYLNIDAKAYDIAYELSLKLESFPDTLDITDTYNYLKENNMLDENSDKNILKIFSLVEITNPKVYYFRGGGTIRQKNNKVFLSDFALDTTKEEHAITLKTIESIFNRNIPDYIKNGSDALKAFYTHNFIILNAQYDVAEQQYNLSKGGKETGNIDSYNPKGVLINKKGVCESYSKTYTLLMQKLGVPTFRVTSDLMGHAWNVSMINGKWYNIDLTYDDLVGIEEDNVNYTYFLKSNQQYINLGHKVADQKYVDLNNTDRDKDPFVLGEFDKGFFKNGIYYTSTSQMAKPLMTKYGIYFITADSGYNLDKGKKIYKYDVDTNSLSKIADCEGIVHKYKDDYVIFKTNYSSQTIDAYKLSNIHTPMARVKVNNLSPLDTTSGSKVASYYIGSIYMSDNFIQGELISTYDDSRSQVFFR